MSYAWLEYARAQSFHATSTISMAQPPQISQEQLKAMASLVSESVSATIDEKVARAYYVPREVVRLTYRRAGILSRLVRATQLWPCRFELGWHSYSY